MRTVLKEILANDRYLVFWIQSILLFFGLGCRITFTIKANGEEYNVMHFIGIICIAISIIIGYVY
jgi:hypothetical protein